MLPILKRAVLLIVLLDCTFLTIPSPAQQTQPSYQNPNLPLQQRVNDLVSRMTLQEKVSQLGHTADAIPRLQSLDQLPPFEDYSMANRTYRYFSGEPLYPFGYGLSYTTFAYSNPRVDNPNVTGDNSVSLAVDVRNIGKVAGDEVVQLYLTHAGIAGAPLRSLEGFQRVHLDPGQQTTVSFKLDGRQLSTVDPSGIRRIEPGAVKVWIGGGQPIARPGLPKTPGVEAQFTITAGSTLPE